MRILLGLFLLLLIIFQTIVALLNFTLPSPNQAPIKVGLVYSLTGSRASREQSVKDANLLAIQEINEMGGIIGRKIEPILKDAQSNWDSTLQAIESLINQEKVDVIFGGWNQGSRYAIKDLLEKNNYLLITPYQYEGITGSPNILNVGASANQQITPAVYYSLKNFGNRFFLVGSNYIYSHIINIMIRDHVKALNGEIVGEAYIPFTGDQNWEKVIQEIVTTRPNVILVSILGNDNSPFFKKLKEAGINPEQTAILSFNLTEPLLQEMDVQDVQGVYAAWNYFQSLPTKENREFIQNFKEYSKLSVADNAAESIYVGVYLWAEAVKEAKSTQISELNYTLQDMRILGPEGIVTLDMNGRHAWKTSRIGRILPNREFEVVWESKSPFRPIPCTAFRSNLEWEELIEGINHKLGETITDLH